MKTLIISFLLFFGSQALAGGKVVEPEICSVTESSEHNAYVVSIGDKTIKAFYYVATNWGSTERLASKIYDNAAATRQLAKSIAKQEVRILALEGKCTLK